MFFGNNFARNYEKKIILGTSDTWLTIRLSHRPSNPANYIVNWRIFDLTQTIVNFYRPTPNESTMSPAFRSHQCWRNSNYCCQELRWKQMFQRRYFIRCIHASNNCPYGILRLMQPNYWFSMFFRTLPGNDKNLIGLEFFTVGSRPASAMIYRLFTIFP